MMKLIFLEEFGKISVPKKYLPSLRQYLLKAGISDSPYRFFGVLFYISLILTMIIYILWINPFLNLVVSANPLDWAIIDAIPFLIEILLTFLSWTLIQAIIVIVFILLVYFYLDIRIYKRTTAMEDKLPDFLQVVSSNLRGGLTFENAIWASIKPQFKTLAQEMAEVSKKVMTGYQMKGALIDFSKKYDSPMLQRSIDLLLSEIESGGNVADLLDRIVDHLKEIKALKLDMAASSVTYVMFIGVIVVTIAPLLSALSFALLLAMLGFTENLAASTANVSSSMPFSISAGIIDPDDFKKFSFMANLVVAFFASMIVSIVEKGNIKSGIKYIPLFCGGSLFFYWIFMSTIPGFFANMF